ncbi:hypothetical protein [Pseudarthrobacter sp. MEB009]|uniref:hypothetical protein n=1 Tax=Pseudarthrobacter sp. MEB009 TaxID=3040326 RepID=UPI0025577850|nr:hypothetical protein [Pseudarthrobacter sp. MEB009]
MDWDEAGGSGVLGASAGNLETKASRDLYTFAVPAGGQFLYLDIGTYPYYGRWQLMSQGTGAQIATGRCWAGDKQVNNFPAGNYTLDFHGVKEAQGTYSFEIR